MKNTARQGVFSTEHIISKSLHRPNLPLPLERPSLQSEHIHTKHAKMYWTAKQCCHDTAIFFTYFTNQFEIILIYLFVY